MKYIKGKELETFDDLRFAERPVIVEKKNGEVFEAELEWMSIDEFIGYKKDGCRFYEKKGKFQEGVWYKIKEYGTPPADFDQVLVYVQRKNGLDFIFLAHYLPDSHTWWADGDFIEKQKVIAWMGIPDIEIY